MIQIFVFIKGQYRLYQGISTGVLGHLWGPRSSSPGAPSRGLY